VSEKSHLFLEVFGIVCHGVSETDVLFVLSFMVFKDISFWVKDDLGDIIEEDSYCSI
jgi:hypothetical protein